LQIAPGCTGRGIKMTFDTAYTRAGAMLVAPPHGRIVATDPATIRQALAAFVYGLFVGTEFITGIATWTFQFNMGGRGWDYLRNLRATK
jgi:hypothetical protein